MKLPNDRTVLLILAGLGLCVIVFCSVAMSFGWFGYGELAMTSAPAPIMVSSVQEQTSQSEKVNINKATALQLEALPGIGEVIANRILEYREQHGSFSQAEELLNVTGIGEKTLEKLKPHIVLE